MVDPTTATTPCASCGLEITDALTISHIEYTGFVKGFVNQGDQRLRVCRITRNPEIKSGKFSPCGLTIHKSSRHEI